MKVLKFGAKDCPGCKVMRPLWEEIEKEYPWLETEYIGVDEHPEVKEQYQLSGLPVFIFLDRQGREIVRFSGEIEKDVLVKAILENRDK